VARPRDPGVLHPARRAPNGGDYDKPGCGLSDDWPGRPTLETDLAVLHGIVDHLGLEQIDLLGMSVGAPVSLAFAARSPERVRRLVVYGGYADGRLIAAAPVQAAMLDLVRAHWGLGSDVLADIFLPDGSTTMKAQFAELQRGAASTEVACQLLAQCYDVRVDDLLDRIGAPTLVLHRRPIAPSRTAWAGTWPGGSRVPGWCRWRAEAILPMPAIPSQSSSRSWSSSARPRCARPCRSAGRARSPRARPRSRPAGGGADQSPDRRAARDRGALGRGTRGADPPPARGLLPGAGRCWWIRQARGGEVPE
jgi:pimeloyl-ACP methyl ester carboxylesterase